ncbi:MAG: di-heme oxidoredictase family protein [Myxococcota bacterium]
MTAARSIAIAGALALGACDAADGAPAQQLPGGDLTVFDRSSNAFRMPGPSLDADELARHLDGDATFEASFVTAPAPVHGGLGPVFNHFSCSGCHPRDGRGQALAGGPPLFSPLLVRVSLPAAMGAPLEPGGAVPLPGIGTQIRDHAVFGATPDATVVLTWVELSAPGTFGDGMPYALRQPHLAIRRPDGSGLPPEAMVSARVAPPVFGLGLLEAVPDASIEALADPDDEDGDGISGRANHAYDARVGRAVLGRFGWKANTPDLELQTAAAYVNDMGVTNPLHPAPDGSVEVDADTLAATTFYVRTLGVPAPADPARGDADRVVRGQRLFASMGCGGCHVETLTTAPAAALPPERRALGDQVIHPYTDLLVHDMGPGLADGRPDWEASGSEWRTAPLWGIGLTETVLPGASYLHDGRARTLAEAILWHGGEAEAAREAFRTATAAEREALLAFLRAR